MTRNSGNSYYFRFKIHNPI